MCERSRNLAFWLAWRWHWVWNSSYTMLLGCYPPSLLQTQGAALPLWEGSPAEDSVKFGGGKCHPRSGFLQTGCGALGIEAVFLSNAGKWSWGCKGGAEQALRSNLGKEKKEREANRNRTVAVCSCNLTWLSPLLARGARDVNIHYHVIFDWLPEFIIFSAVTHWILTKPIPLPKKGLYFLIFTE